MALTVLTVPDISCEHCERAVTGALVPAQGVRDVTVHVPTKQVLVIYNEGLITIDQMQDILANAGYPVASVETLVTARDPVCGMDVDPATARYMSRYRGRTYHFCCPGCKRTFGADPEAYLIAH